MADIVRITNNLFDKSLNETYPQSTLGNVDQWAYGAATGIVVRIACEPDTTYNLSIDSSISTSVFRISLTNSTNTPISGQTGSIPCVTTINDSSLRNATFTTLSDTKYILFQPNSAVIQDAVDTLMLNYGSTALPYEPYRPHSLQIFDGAVWQDASVYEF